MLDPRLKHLNADTSWLLSIPLPSGDIFNALIDPWLTGPQTDYFKLLSTQWHTTPSCILKISQLDVDIHAVVRVIMLLVSTILRHPDWTRSLAMNGLTTATRPPFSRSQSPSLFMRPREVQTVFSSVPEPIKANLHLHQKAESLIRSWKHFDAVYTIPYLTKGLPWSVGHLPQLPDQISITRLATKGEDFAYYHAAVCIAFNQMGSDSSSASSIIYTPHGIHWDSLNELEESGIKSVLALLHGLHEVTNPKLLGGKLNLGGRNGVKLADSCKPKYWIGTHDEVKKGSGIVSKVLQRKIWTVEEALREEGMDPGKATFIELASGDELRLE